MKRIISVLLAIFICLNMASVSNAATRRTLPKQNATLEYAKQIYGKHVHALITAGELEGEMADYLLGEELKVYNVVEGSEISCFPIIRDDEIEAIMDVKHINGEYESSLAVSFAKELQKMRERGQLSRFIVLTDGNHVQFYDGNQCSEVYEMFEDNQDESMLVENVPGKKLKQLFFEANCVEKLGEIVSVNSLNSVTNSGRPQYTKCLNVKGVAQGAGKPWCWAATCAAMINYLKGESLKAKDVAHYIYPPNDAEHSGDSEQIEKAYRHWGVNCETKGVVSFSKVKTQIENNKPMHLRVRRDSFTGGLVGADFDWHSIGLIGYEDWAMTGGSNKSKVLILLEPNGGVRRTVTLNSYGNFTYNLSESQDGFIWEKTRLLK